MGMLSQNARKVGIVERAVVWVLVMLIQALAFSVLIIGIGHGQQPVGLSDVVVGCFAVLYVFLISGYIFTTGLVYLFMTQRDKWLAPLSVEALFLIHFEILNRFIVRDGVATPNDRTLTRLVGTCIALVTAGAGVWILKQRTKSSTP